MEEKLHLREHEIEAWTWIAAASFVVVILFAVLTAMTGHDWQFASNDTVMPPLQ
jgi:hypothetical protein